MVVASHLQLIGVGAKTAVSKNGTHMIRPATQSDIQSIAGLAGVTYYTPVEATDRAWSLKMIGVHPNHQRRGIGTAIMNEVERRLREANARLVLVETSATPEYDRARAFYASLGYEEEARVRDYFADGDDMVMLRKRLTPATP